MKLRIGSRRSRLALAQAREVADGIGAMGVETEIVPFVTSGDRGISPVGPGGVKGSFVAEIVRALQDAEVDLAVHSAKDLPSLDPEGIVVGAVPDRAAPFDVMVSREADLPDGGIVGTSSIRRKAQLLRSRPELRIVDLRGNVDTRLAKLEEGSVDALVLAAAGLARLGVAPPNAMPLPVDEMVPAPGQGALAVQVRADDQVTLEVVRQIEHRRSRLAFDAERGLVARLGGDCSLPLGAYAEEREEGVRLLAVVVKPDGTDLVWAQAEAANPLDVAGEVAEMLLAGGAGAILAEAQAGR